MVRTYKRKIGGRRYADYSAQTLQECLKAIDDGMRISDAANVFNICRRTIYNKRKERTTANEEESVDTPSDAENDSTSPRKPGGQPVFSEAEEKAFVDHLLLVVEFGFPVTKIDLRMIVKRYLVKTGREVPMFRDGTLPGPDWVDGFLRRHPNVAHRVAKNIKSDRAAVSEESFRQYMEHLKKSLEGVSPDCIYNYDETNLSDDPGSQKVMVRRGVKYPELIRNSSKTAVSIIMCGNAEGKILPPYVVYKAN